MIINASSAFQQRAPEINGIKSSTIYIPPCNNENPEHTNIGVNA